MSTIQKGDLVMIVRPNPCGCLDRVGRVFTVTKVRPSKPIGICSTCAYRADGATIVVVEGDTQGTVNIARLIKIDPPAQPESVEHDEWVSV